MFGNVRKVLFIIFIFLCYSMAYAVDSAGVIIDIAGGAWVERDGSKTVLRLKTPVFVTDVITTDADGSLQILFNDDTSLAVGASSSVSIDNFVFDMDSQAGFAVSALKGVSRVITGKVVEQNREGFKVKTPLATVGIRGTIVSFDVNETHETIMLEQIGAGHDLLISTADGKELSMNEPGFKVGVSDGGGVSSPTPITAADQSKINNALNSPGESTGDSGDDSDDDSTTANTGATNGINPGFDDGSYGTSSSLGAQQDSIRDEANEFYPPQASVNEKHVSYQSQYGLHGFKAELLSGSVTEAYFTHNDIYGVVQATGGTGTIKESKYDQTGIHTGAEVDISGFTNVETNGAYDKSLVGDITVSSKFLDSSADVDIDYADGARLDYAFDYNGVEDAISDFEYLYPILDGSDLNMRDISTMKNAYFIGKQGKVAFTVDLETLGVSNITYVENTYGSIGARLLTGATGTLEMNPDTGAYKVLTTSNFTSAEYSGIFKLFEGSTNTMNIVFNADGVQNAFLSTAGYSTHMQDDNFYINPNGYNVPGGIDGFNVVNTAYYQSANNTAGFTLSLVDLSVSDAYFLQSTGNGSVLVKGGTGALALNGVVQLSNMDFSNATYETNGFAEENDIDKSKTTMSGSLTTIQGYFFTGASITTGLNYNSSNLAGSHSAIITAPDKYQQPTLGSSTVASYQYNSGDTELGFKIDVATGEMGNAYIVKESAGDVYLMTDGRGTWQADGSGGYNIYLDQFVDNSAGFNHVSAQPTTVTGVLGADNSFSGSSADNVFTTSGTVANGNNFDEPTMAEFTKQATYTASNFTLGTSTTYNANASFSVDFIANEVTSATLNVGDVTNFANFETTGATALGAFDSNDSSRAFNVQNFQATGTGGSLADATVSNFYGTLYNTSQNQLQEVSVDVGITAGGSNYTKNGVSFTK